MARKRHSDEDILKLLREIELKLANGSDVASACCGVGISDATYITTGVSGSAVGSVSVVGDAPVSRRSMCD